MFWKGIEALRLQMEPQGSDGLLLSPLHRHGADLEPRGCGPQRQTLQEREPQSRSLGGGQLFDQLL